jgi:hypothetical protein
MEERRYSPNLRNNWVSRAVGHAGSGIGTGRHSPIDTYLMMGERIGEEDRLFQAHVGREKKKKAAKKKSK